MSSDVDEDDHSHISDDEQASTTTTEDVGFSERSVSPPDLIAEAQYYVNNPLGGRRWLRSYGDREPATDVSLKFLITNENRRETQPFSILPLLTLWLEKWRSVVRGKPGERQHFAWLLQYTQDYIRLGHVSLPESELVPLCQRLIHLCETATEASDIEAAVDIFHAVTEGDCFPAPCLQSALRVFCMAVVLLERQPALLVSCVKHLAFGPRSQETVELLQQTLLYRDSHTSSREFSCAKGAARILANILDHPDSQGKYPVDLQQLVSVLQRTADFGHYRMCSEVLRLFHAVFIGQRGPELVASPVEFESALHVIKQCLKTRYFPDLNTSSSQSSRQEHASKIDRYTNERDRASEAVCSGLESLIPKMKEDQRLDVHDVFLLDASRLSSSQISWALGYANSEGLCLPGREKWDLRTSTIFDRFVKNANTAPSQRLSALKACTSAARHAVGPSASRSASPVASESDSTIGYRMVVQALDLVSTEINTAFYRGMLESLVELASIDQNQQIATDANRNPYAPAIIAKLTAHVLDHDLVDETLSDEHFLLATQAIRRIFFNSIASHAATANAAFKALLQIAHPSCQSRRSRLAAMRVLFRLRCDTEGMVYVDVNPVSESIAAALVRTDESDAIFNRDRAGHTRRSTGGHSHPDVNSKTLWMYPKETATVTEWDLPEFSNISIKGVAPRLEEHDEQLQISEWLFIVIQCVQSDADWETYTYAVTHLGAQLINMKLFSGSLPMVVQLRKILCDQVMNVKFQEPPVDSGLRRSDVALCIFHILTSLIPYAKIDAKEIQLQGFGDDLVRAFSSGVTSSNWEGTARSCIHALSLCCFEVPMSIADQYPSIVDKMQKSMSQPHLVVHILEFLAQVARLPQMHSNFNKDEIRMIIGMCTQFLYTMRDQQQSLSSPAARAGTPGRSSGLNLRRPPYRAAMVQEKGLPQYSSALAYHTMIFWFLSLRLEERARYVSWIVPRFVYRDTHGQESIDEQSQVFVDFMQRTAFSDLGETTRKDGFCQPSDGPVKSASWLIGLSVVTAETAGGTGLTQITKRQAAGTTYAMYQQLTSATPIHHIPSHANVAPGTEDDEQSSMLPSHVLLQMVATAAPTSAEDLPFALPSEPYIDRALKAFDRLPTVDSHKIGVLYIKEGQTKETEYLANNETSPDFDTFLRSLGHKVSLEGTLRFNPQGLECPTDGTHTVAWRDRINEIVYHVPTMMPSDGEGRGYVRKKSHLGNCHVLVVFNRSGLSWHMDRFPSQVTLVNIVITPVDRRSWRTAQAPSEPDFFRVQVMTKEENQNISPAADAKVVSKSTLAPFVRMIALNANIYSQAQVAVNQGDHEFPSSWRARLQAIKRLKEQVLVRTGAAAASPVGAGGNGSRTSSQREERENTLVEQMDFGKWSVSS